MTARDEILGRVRGGLAKGDFATRRAQAEAYIAAQRRGPQPVMNVTRQELVARFQRKAESLASTVEVVADAAAVPAAVAAYLARQTLPTTAVSTHDVAGLAWAGAGLEVVARPAVDADQVGITGCFCAIAETGTIMLLSSPETPATVSLLPETHIALIKIERIVATMEEAFALVRVERGELPRAINFISGPSRTGDIEQTIVLGAHGPCRVHLIMIGAVA